MGYRAGSKPASEMELPPRIPRHVRYPEWYAASDCDWIVWHLRLAGVNVIDWQRPEPPTPATFLTINDQRALSKMRPPPDNSSITFESIRR